MSLIFSGMRLLLNPCKPEGPKGTKVYYGPIKRSRHGPQCGHTPLDLQCHSYFIFSFLLVYNVYVVIIIDIV